MNIASGLMRKSIVKPSKWAEKYRVMGKPFPGPWRFDHHPWAREMMDSEALANVGQKAAQMAFTEVLLNLTFFRIDIQGESVLYLLPTADDASDFSASRFDPALESSAHIKSMFTSANNIALKRAGSAILYVRGTRSTSKLKSVPARIINFDEYDEMDQSKTPLALERASGQEDPITWKISTPTVNDFGISKEYDESTQEHFFFKCAHCS
jgi:phage terminase large subunit GpA-like protein